jgi:phosphoribosylamine--glycine ligase
MRLPASVNVLLLGSGGREHALAWKIAASPRTGRLFVAPGNGGTAQVATNVDLQPTNFGTLKQFILMNHINLVVVGPEEPLVKGVVDFIRGDGEIHHVPVIGPMAAAARLEGSKAFAKAFMERHAIPTAAYRSFTAATIDEGYEFLAGLRAPYVLKADGLAAGKGVVIVPTLDEARAELAAMLGGKFGAAGATVVVEEFLQGIECSVFVATDGRNYKILPVAKDYKRIGEGDTGPNTGGMGAVSPVPFAGDEFMRKVEERIVKPTIEGLAAEKISYKGFIFIGLMNVGGEPFVIEYNVRMGDPETEVVFPRIVSDAVELFEGIVCDALDGYELKVSPLWATTVVCVSGGYPGDYEKGFPIVGLNEKAGKSVNNTTTIFHAGTRRAGEEIVTSGGRVLAVTSLGATMDEALASSYAAIGGISFDGMYFRRDIGWDLR